MQALGHKMQTPCSSGFRGQALASKARAPAQGPRSMVVFAQQRQLWYPGGEAPKHLKNELPGDYGFDPLKLGEEDTRLKWFQQAELVHSRLAMTGVAGILIPGLLSKFGILGPLPAWPEAGKVWIESHPSFPLGSMLYVQLLLCGWVEAKRWMDFVNPGSQGDGSFLGITEGFKGRSNGYPGGVFDPFNYSRDEDSYNEFKVKEVKNGRLAMLAFLGFVAQYAATGKGPIDNLFEHLSDPSHINFATNGVSLPFVR